MFRNRIPLRRLGQEQPAQQQDPMALNEQIYQQAKPDLIPDFLGQFALIHNQELVEVYPEYQTAFDDAIKRGFVPGSFLIKEITEEEPIETI